MDIFDRLKRIRVYRQLRQKDIADWYGISVQSWGNKERGKEGGFGLAEIKLFLEKANIDPRYLFGAIENIEDADLLRKILEKLFTAHPDECRQLIGTGIIEERYFDDI